MGARQPELSFSEFIAWEATQSELHELVNGAVVPFRAGSADHELITGNAFARLHATVELPCLVFPSTTIVQTTNRRGKDSYRPDVTVSCSARNVGKREFISEPRIILEVISPSNSGREWNLKLFEYWSTENIEQIVLIDSLVREATSLVRGAHARWLPPVTVADDGLLAFSPIGISMTLAQVYRNTSIAV